MADLLERDSEIASTDTLTTEIRPRPLSGPAVEVHPSNTYRKLEIKGRRELASVLAPAAAA